MESFNSLFEMRVVQKPDDRGEGARAFNSLFEMLYTTACRNASSRDSLSILYLRCRRPATQRLSFSDNFTLSILYLRCRQLVEAGLLKPEASFNSLFEMRGSRTYVRRMGSLQTLSILYLRCQHPLYGRLL